MALRYLVFASVFGVVLGSAHYYVWARLVRDAELPSPWGRALTIVVVALFVLLMTSLFVSRVVPRTIAMPLMYGVYTWLGVLFLLTVSVAVTDIGRVIALRVADGAPEDPERRLAITRMFAGLAAVLGLGASAIGVVSAMGPVAVKRVRVAIDRLAKAQSGFRIVQISDVHVGPTIGRHFIEGIVESINALDADVVAITGDLVDGKVEQLREHVEPLGRIKAKHGVFFVTGNHEYYSGADEWIAHLRSLGIRVLRNEHVAIGELDLAGVDDASAHTFGNGHGADLGKALAGRDTERACVLLAHQPRGIHEADRLGVDLQLSGHTHGGQLFPWGLMVRLQQPFVAGLHKLTRAWIYVSRGTGYWGPPMRVGAPAEITEIELVRSA